MKYLIRNAKKFFPPHIKELLSSVERIAIYKCIENK